VRVVVVGAGISGLTAAWRLQGLGHDVTCVDPSRRPGGLIRSERRDGFLCEVGPQAIVDGAPETRALVTDLELAPEVVRPAPAARRRYVYTRGRLRAVPTTPPSLLSSDLLSLAGKWRLLREPWVKPRPLQAEEESVLAFAERRLGPEAARNLVGPAIIGIFAGDAARLSLRSALPRLHDLETQHGSLLRGLRALRKGGALLGKSFSFRQGLERLPQALSTRLGDRLRHAEVHELHREGDGSWSVELRPSGSDVAESPPPILKADAVVLATPPRVTASLLAPLLPEAAQALRSVPLAPVAVVCLGFQTTDIGMDLNAYGFLVAREQGPKLLGCQYESTIFPGRAPAGCVLLRALYGGTFDPDAVEESDDALVRRAWQELRTIAGLSRFPDVTAVWRIRDAIPQYELGHLARVTTVERATATLPGLHVLGLALFGIGVNDCIRAATQLARTIG
jgi:protoporphyrinogen/coproporphyrinogen III oxidase